MANKKLGVIRRGILKMKLLAPSGVRLNEGETVALIDTWRDDRKVLEKSQTSLRSASEAIESNLHKLPDTLQEVTKAKQDAARYFKITKDPFRKREWAGRLVIADRARTAIKGSQKRMQVMRERVKTLVEDATIEKKALDIRIAEAEAYSKMGSGLKLVGQSLVEARARAKESRVEFSNFELGIESLEKTVKGESDSKLIEEAERILGKNEKSHSNHDNQPAN